MSFMQIDWRALVVPTVGLAELFIRGSVMYLGMLILMRLLRRQKGALNTADLLVLIVIADAAQNGMASEYTSLTEGLFLVGTIFLWDYGLDILAYRWPRFRRVLHEPPLALITNGRLQHHNLRREMLTKEDVLEQLRERGIDDIRRVKQCCLEADGHFSVVTFDGEPESAPEVGSSPVH